MHKKELFYDIVLIYAKQHNFKEVFYMKSFLSLFTDSFYELKKVRTITFTGMLIAVAIALRSVAIQITPDVRISFAFLAIAIIGMLFGPVISGAANFLTDFLGFLFFDKTGQPYSPLLGLVVFLSGVIYGIFMYKKEFRFLLSALSRVAVVLICNLCLNSIIIYLSFVNKSFDITSQSQLTAFWIWFSPRLIKSLIQLIPDIVLMSIAMPAAMTVYKQILKIKTIKA